MCRRNLKQEQQQQTHTQTHTTHTRENNTQTHRAIQWFFTWQQNKFIIQGNQKSQVTTAVRLYIELFTFQYAIQHGNRQNSLVFVLFHLLHFWTLKNLFTTHTHTTHFPSVDKPCSRALISRVRSRPNPHLDGNHCTHVFFLWCMSLVRWLHSCLSILILTVYIIDYYGQVFSYPTLVPKRLEILYILLLNNCQKQFRLSLMSITL